jgi:glycogen debranching enzyme
VWAWLIGPFIDAWCKVYPTAVADARGFLDGLVDALDRFGHGTIGEIFDAEPPFTPRGCVAQAWSVAEVLRCLVKTSVAERESAPRPARGAEPAPVEEGVEVGASR